MENLYLRKGKNYNFRNKSLDFGSAQATLLSGINFYGTCNCRPSRKKYLFKKACAWKLVTTFIVIYFKNNIHI